MTERSPLYLPERSGCEFPVCSTTDARLEPAMGDFARTHLISARERKNLLRSSALLVEELGRLTLAQDGWFRFRREHAPLDLAPVVEGAISQLLGAISHARGYLAGTCAEMQRTLLQVGTTDANPAPAPIQPLPRDPSDTREPWEAGEAAVKEPLEWLVKSVASYLALRYSEGERAHAQNALENACAFCGELRDALLAENARCLVEMAEEEASRA